MIHKKRQEKTRRRQDKTSVEKARQDRPRQDMTNQRVCGVYDGVYDGKQQLNYMQNSQSNTKLKN
jgi:hypothetical protein